VILVDANLLIYAVNADFGSHRKARAWLESVISGPETVGLSWNVLLAFLRLTTRSAAMRHPLSSNEAFNLMDAWLNQPSVSVVQAGPCHLRILRDLLLPLGIAGNLTSDAHLAALAIEYGAVLCSSDTDFGRFQGLKWCNPLA